MGAQQSKDALLYEQVGYGNGEGIKALRREGAGLEWIDKEGKTPLILASLRPELVQVAKVLIDLGANVNAYRPGSHAGTPLHHAAKKGLVQTVELLLSHGANPLVMNDDCQTSLDLARAKGHWNVVRLIETRICLFAGWVREVHGPSILEAIIRQWVSKKVWAVILPCDSRNSAKGPKYELAIYSDLQAAHPNPLIQLWKVHIEDPLFNQADPALVIVDKATKKRYKFHSENEGNKQQLRLLYNACRGARQHSGYFPVAPSPVPPPMPNTPQPNPHASTSAPVPPQPASEDVELAMAINASIQLAIAEGVPLPDDARPVATGGSDFNGWGASSTGDANWGLPVGPAPSGVSTPVDPYKGWATKPQASQSEAAPVITGSVGEASPAPSVPPAPSAPPLAEETFYGGPIQYPSIDSSPIDLTMPAWEAKHGTGEASESGTTSEAKDGSSISGSCVICLDAPVEGACIPCGHVAGCMSCLKEIRAKKWGCPVCRAKIDQVIKLYAV